MAASTTTQATMLSLEILSEAEIERLSTPRQRDATTDAGLPFPWRGLHERAWARVVRELLDRSDPILETSLSTVSELARATCYLVAAYAYETAESPSDMERAAYFHRLHLREMSEVSLTTSLGSIRRSGVGCISFPSRRAG
jgi:hypothetical protein